MISRQDIERIEQLPDTDMVLMAVIHDSPADVDNEGGGLTTRAKVLMKEAGVPLTVMDQVLDDLTGPRSSRSALYVVGGDLFERYDLQLDLPERVHYGRPNPAILQSVLEASPSVGVLAMDREWARLFVLEQGELQELTRQENGGLTRDRGDSMTTGTRHAPGTPGSGGTDQGSGPRSDSANDLFQNYQDAQQHQFYKDMEHRLQIYLRELGLKALVLVGPEERVADFRAVVPEKAPYEVIGHTNANVGTGSVGTGKLRNLVMPLVEAYQNQQDDQLLADIQEKGVMEVERVLELAQQGNLYRLAIPEDGAQMHLYRSHNREVPYLTSREVQESPLDGSLMERVTLEEALPQLTALSGTQVRRLRGDHAARLVKEFGGLAGLPRY